jgi:hypothetical protein
MSEKPLVNRVAASSLITLDLEKYYPEVNLAHFDIKDYLFKELILREKDFREALKVHDWEQYQGKTLLVYCSSDAIIPIWAYMLVASHATPFTEDLFQGTEEVFLENAYSNIIDALDPAAFEDQRIVIKGCSDKKVPLSAYLNLTQKLQPIAKSILFGEPCSTVPIYKKPKK